MNQPTPALVTQRAVQRLPRIALVLLCAAYALPGLFGRDPWRNADLTAFGYMYRMAEGLTPWLAPTVGDLPAETALLPHWLGAWAIQALQAWMAPALAARLPFAALLLATLTLVWYATFHLARTEAAQPLPFAFGGEAAPVDYAHALADGALLATIATLGLLQLGHETTPELMQLTEVALLLWALAIAPYQPHWARTGLLLALPGLAISGAPAVAMLMGGLAAVICQQSRLATARRLLPWVLGALVLAGLLATLIGAWQWRIIWRQQAESWLGFVRLLIWFAWPCWPLALWTLWRWRRHWTHRHIAVPLSTVVVALLSAMWMGGSDRALMLGLPGLAMLAAFALPTLKRSAGAAMDWFSVFFFTLAALTIWVIYLSMQWGVPAQPRINIMRLAPGFVPEFSALALGCALLGSLCWLGLVRWRTARHQHALWKSLVLPASGVALAWLLTMTLLLPPLDHGRSPRPLARELARLIPPGSCVLAPGLSRANVAGLELFGPYTVHAGPQAVRDKRQACNYQISAMRGNPAVAEVVPAGWELLEVVRRPTDKSDRFLVLKRIAAS